MRRPDAAECDLQFLPLPFLADRHESATAQKHVRVATFLSSGLLIVELAHLLLLSRASS